MRVFVSNENSNDPLSRTLVARLSRDGWSVDQSPTSPVDPRWCGWYSVGCARAVAAADVIVAVFTAGWDGSTWMCHEADVALKTPRPLFLWNPEKRQVPRGMVRYADRLLPDDLDDALALLADVKPALARDVTALPIADAGLEQHARDLFPLAMSPEEYAARHAHEWSCFSFDDYRYSDRELTVWVQRLGDILFHRNPGVTLDLLRARYLTLDERSQVQGDDKAPEDPS